MRRCADHHRAARSAAAGRRARAAPPVRGRAAALLRAAHGEPPLLVDVREDLRVRRRASARSFNIPLGELPQRLAEIAHHPAPVFICRSGGRSLAACQLALRAGVPSPANLEGGLLAWAREIDPALRVL